MGRRVGGRAVTKPVNKPLRMRLAARLRIAAAESYASLGPDGRTVPKKLVYMYYNNLNVLALPVASSSVHVRTVNSNGSYAGKRCARRGENTPLERPVIPNLGLRPAT